VLTPLSRRSAGLHLAVLASYAALAVLFVWPLPLHLTNHITGDPAGDAGAYVWNAYVFSRNISSGSSVLQTDQILSFANQVSLALHNNSLFLSALSAPLITSLGVIGGFNAALIGVLILNPFCAYLLAWHETRSRGPALLAGALFGFSPFISARVEGHMSLATAFALPLVLLAARRAMASKARLDWALVGAALALCAVSDPYYLVFGVMAVAVVWLFERLTIERLAGIRPRLGMAAAAMALLSGSAILWIVLGGGGQIALGSIRVGVRSPYTPVLVLTLSLLLLAIALRPRRVVFTPGFLRDLKYPALSGTVAAVLLYPWLSVAAAQVFSKGGTESPLWRSSPIGIDLLSFLLPNPTHPWFREFIEPWMTTERPDAFVEGVASLTVSAILVGFLLLAYGRSSLPKFWLVFTVFFATLAAGPFVHVGGESTYIPGPWALLRFVPAIGMVRSPTRFAVMAILGVSLLLAFALATARLGRFRIPVLAGAGLLMGLETMGLPRRTFPVALPQAYQVVADDRCDVVVLRLPTGIKDGTRQRGRFNSRTQFRQVFHGKRLLGGYLSRLSDETVSDYEHHPTISALLDLSEGKTLSADERREGIRKAPTLARRVGIGFVVVNRAEASQELRDFVQEAFYPRPINKVWPLTISIPFGETCENGDCGHRLGCPHRPIPKPPQG
jgi:hypothetical protein